MKKLLFVVVVLSFYGLSAAETSSAIPDNKQQRVGSQKSTDASQALPNSGFASDTCSFNFTSGTNNTFLSYCVSDNGNILNIVTPVGQQHVFGREGYGFCDINSNTEYFDYAGAGNTSNWNPGIVLSSSPTKVKIARTTSDGIWTLTQTIMQVPTSSSIKVTMTLKNNTLVSREVQLSRFADIDAVGNVSNTVDATINDAMIYNSLQRGVPYGLALQNVGTSPFTYLGFVQNIPSAVLNCSPFTHLVTGPVINTDGSAVMTYVITIPAGASKTVNVGYRGL